jgi:hypothetical protein
MSRGFERGTLREHTNSDASPPRPLGGRGRRMGRSSPSFRSNMFPRGHRPLLVLVWTMLRQSRGGAAWRLEFHRPPPEAHAKGRFAFRWALPAFAPLPRRWDGTSAVLPRHGQEYEEHLVKGAMIA